MKAKNIPMSPRSTILILKLIVDGTTFLVQQFMTLVAFIRACKPLIMVAYEGRRRIERETVDTEVRPIRKLLLNLESKHQLTIAHHDRFSLESFKARWNAMKTQLMRRTGQ